MKPEKTSLEKARELIKTSGNNFHYQVRNALRDNGWEVTVSQFYNDAFSQKPREIDLIAEKAFSSDHYSSSNVTVIVRLFIECKYITSTTVFWLDERNQGRAKDIVNDTDAFNDVNTNVLVEQKHHYLAKSKISKLFTSEKSFGKEAENDPIYKAITQSLNALIYFRPQSTKLSEKHEHRDIVELNYPVIICNTFNEFFSQEAVPEIDPQSMSSQGLLQLEIDYAYTQKNSQTEELFYIDVFPLEKLTLFEEMLKQGDIEIATQKLGYEERVNQSQQMSEEQEAGNDDPYYGSSM